MQSSFFATLADHSLPAWQSERIKLRNISGLSLLNI